MWLIFEAEIQQGGGRRYFVGLDLAKDKDFSAFSIIEQRVRRKVIHPPVMSGRPPFVELENATYITRHLERWKLGTPATTVVAGVKEICGPSSLVQPWVVLDGEKEACVDERCKIAIDMLKESGLQPVAITLTNSHHAHLSGAGGISVPKRDVIGAMAMLFETRELKLASMITLIPEFLTELKAFHMSISPSGRDSYAATGSVQDDLILCTALPLWYAIQQGKQDPLQVLPKRVALQILSAIIVSYNKMAKIGIALLEKYVWAPK